MVCVGNICRSPTAEYLLRHKLPGSATQVKSAGLGALAGKPADPTAQAILEEQGVDMSAHVARQISTGMANDADLILVMEPMHLNALYEIAPQVRGRSFLLGKWLDDQAVPDPYRQQRPAFEHAYQLIDQATDAWLKYLR